MKTFLLNALFFSIALTTFAQTGPGGVSDDDSETENCRLWFDAGDLAEVGDGNPVTLWEDKSDSDVLDTAYWNTDFEDLFAPPIFRSSPAYSMNGKPVVSYEDGGMLVIGNDSEDAWDDLSTAEPDGTTYKRTIFFAFRTGSDVSSRQFVWEQGGGTRGINVYIEDSEIYIGAYDAQPDDADGVPGFGYSYKTRPIQPNTTYVLSYVLDLPTNNTVTTDPDALRGSLNGGAFGGPIELGTGSNQNQGVGGIGEHTNPLGVGGINSLTSYHEGFQSSSGSCVNNTAYPCFNLDNGDDRATGQDVFTGRLAEVCYYAYNLNDAERIIVENYLAAKYFANTIADDKYVYQTGYGNGVIGVGQETDSEQHNVSQGDAIFEMSVDLDAAFIGSTPKYLLVGHNNNPLTFTTQNTPDSATVQRVNRTYRFDRTGQTPGDSKEVTLKFNEDDLPALPGPDYRYGLLIDDVSTALPNFSSADTKLYELAEITSDFDFEIELDIEDGAFMTLAAFKPTVEFELNTDSGVEGNAGLTAKTVDLNLNHIPVNQLYSVTLDFEDNTAENTTDYQFNSANETADFSVGATTATTGFSIIGDGVTTDDDPVESFFIVIAGTNNGLLVGEQDTLTYRIFDDDPPPKVTFTEASYTRLENAGTVKIPLEVIGTLTSNSQVTVAYAGGSGTAVLNEDFAMTSPQTLNFSSTQSSDSVEVTLMDDPLDEFDETFTLEITGVTGEIGFSDTLSAAATITIVDDDPLPIANFASSSSEGFEAVAQPRITIELSNPSAKVITIPFTRTGGSALDPEDYQSPLTSDVVVPAGDTIAYLYVDPLTFNNALNVYSDGEDEPDETINFVLNTGITNAVLGIDTAHTYTIRDYAPFEWTGVAGVGQFRDNTFWLVPDAVSSNGTVGSMPNLSPRPILFSEDDGFRQPYVTTESGGLNGRRALRFINGTNDRLRVGGSDDDGRHPLINRGGFYDSKSIFFVFEGEDFDGNDYQTIYEQGASSRGISIYLHDSKLHFQLWNTPDDDNEGLSPWGDPNNGGNVVAITGDLDNNEPYVVSCHYDRFDPEPLRVYINGEKVATYTGFVGRLYNHGGRTAIGGVYGNSRFVDGQYDNQDGRNFEGEIAEFLYFNEPHPGMNEARIRIIHNYFSAKYNIPLVFPVQDFNLLFADAETGEAEFNYGVAGLGAKADGSLHATAQGRSEMRVTAVGLSGSDRFLTWGHNNVALTNTFPFSYGNADLPGSVVERTGRIWRFSTQETDPFEDVEISINFSGSNNSEEIANDRSILRLLVHNNNDDAQDFSNATVYEIADDQPPLNEPVVVFTGVELSNGAYVALGNTSPINATPLPIELLSFDARFDGNVVHLHWATASEINNDYFVIERSQDGQVWDEVVVTSGAGNSNSRIDYREKDREPLQGLSYYRLKQVDFDGGYEYSEVVSIVNNTAQDNDEVYLFPNPSSGNSVFLRIPTVFNTSPADISIYNMSGVEVHRDQYPMEVDLYEVTYGNLTSGMYILEIRSELMSESKKLVIRR